jgi:type III restriction enzyme
MELKPYQKSVLSDLTHFLALLTREPSIRAAYRRLWQEKGVRIGMNGLPDYQMRLPNVPEVCFKVPTGGGKTFIAASSLKPIFDSMPPTRTKAVVWLVPSDAILSQTYKNLSDPT